MMNEADYAFSIVSMILAPIFYGATIQAFIWWCAVLVIWFLIRISGYLPYCGFRADVSYATDDTDLNDPNGDIERLRMIHLPFTPKRFQAYRSSSGWRDVKIKRFALNGNIKCIRNVLTGSKKHRIYRGAYVTVELTTGEILINTHISEDADLIFYRQLFRWYNRELSPYHQSQPRSGGWYSYVSWF